MVSNVSKRRFNVLFMEGLIECFKDLVNVFYPLSLKEAIKRALNLDIQYPRTILLKNTTFGSTKENFSERRISHTTLEEHITK